jgi:membrane protein YqaA with SNARE-associated domain
MTSRTALTSIDNFVSSRMALILAFVWGFFEATIFFIVPDVLLTLIACRALRPALRATVAAVIGALAGGALMYLLGAREPTFARVLLDHIPAISPALIARVAGQMDEAGLMAVLLGPFEGIPYKIYAVEWGARGGGFLVLMLISIPARYGRFFLTALIARAIARLIEPVTHHRAGIEIIIPGVIWIAFYGLYFARLGW